jgi:hypothetical protein
VLLAHCRDCRLRQKKVKDDESDSIFFYLDAAIRAYPVDLDRTTSSGGVREDGRVFGREPGVCLGGERLDPVLVSEVSLG